jgi:dUTPase
MINLGPSDFTLTPGMAIAQLIIEEVKGELIENESQFQDQSSPEGLTSRT